MKVLRAIVFIASPVLVLAGGFLLIALPLKLLLMLPGWLSTVLVIALMVCFAYVSLRIFIEAATSRPELEPEDDPDEDFADSWRMPR